MVTRLVILLSVVFSMTGSPGVFSFLLSPISINNNGVTTSRLKTSTFRTPLSASDTEYGLQRIDQIIEVEEKKRKKIAVQLEENEVRE